MVGLNSLVQFRLDLGEIEKDLAAVDIPENTFKDLSNRYGKMSLRLDQLTFYAHTENSADLESIKGRMTKIRDELEEIQRSFAPLSENPSAGSAEQKIEEFRERLLNLPSFASQVKNFKESFGRFVNTIEKGSHEEALKKISDEADLIEKLFKYVTRKNTKINKQKTTEKIEKYRQKVLDMKKDVQSKYILEYCDSFVNKLTFLETYKKNRILGSFNQFQNVQTFQNAACCTCCAGFFLLNILGLPDWSVIGKECIDASIQRGQEIFGAINLQKEEQLELMQELSADGVTLDMGAVEYNSSFLSWDEIKDFFPELSSNSSQTFRLTPGSNAREDLLDALEKKKGDLSIGAIIIYEEMSYAIALKEGSYLFFDSHGNHFLNGSSQGFCAKFEKREDFLSLLSKILSYDSKEAIMFPVVSKKNYEAAAYPKGIVPSEYLEQRPRLQFEHFSEGFAGKNFLGQMKTLHRILQIIPNDHFDKTWLDSSFESLKQKLSQEALDKINQKKAAMPQDVSSEELFKKIIEDEEHLLEIQKFDKIFEEAIREGTQRETYIKFLNVKHWKIPVSEEELIKRLLKLAEGLEVELDDKFDEMSNDAVERFLITTPLLDQKLHAIVDLIDNKYIAKAITGHIFSLPEAIKKIIWDNLKEKNLDPDEEIKQRPRALTTRNAVCAALESMPVTQIKECLDIIKDSKSQEDEMRILAFKDLLLMKEEKDVDQGKLKKKVRKAFDLLGDIEEMQRDRFFANLWAIDDRGGEAIFKEDPLAPSIVTLLEKILKERDSAPSVKRQKTMVVDITNRVINKLDKIKNEQLSATERTEAFKQLVKLKQEYDQEDFEIDEEYLKKQIINSFYLISDLQDFTSAFLARLLALSGSEATDGEAIFKQDPLHPNVLTALNLAEIRKDPDINYVT